MDFKNIIYISGKGGLFELAGNRSNGVIAKSIEDGTTQFYSSRIHQFTPLDSIEMYTIEDNVPLRKIMQSAKEKFASNPPVDNNSDNETLKKYFKIVLPNYDEDRVKISDIKKFIKWFAICKDMNFEETEETTTNAEQFAEPVVETVTETSKTNTSKSTKKEETSSDLFGAEAEEKPAKKTARKKAVKEETTEDAPTKEKKPRATKKKAE
ncbi:MAG: hypothetical protein RL065_1815 [Bacteroidota bacterium]|jgi:hypothetical protein